MERQEILNAWSQLENRVEKCVALQVALHDRMNHGEMKRIRNRTLWSPLADVAVSVIGALVLGGFAADNFQAFLAAPVTAVPTLFLFAFAIFLINMSIRQLVLSSELDYAKPIVETQSHLAKLRKLRLQTTQGAFLFALPAWVLFPILLGQMVIDVKFILALNPAWVIGNIALGLALTPVINWAMKRSRYAQSLRDALVGKDILEAETFLRDLEEFREG